MGEGTRLFDGTATGWVETQTAKISYRRIGSGEPLVFLHGWPLWSFTFRKLLPYLVDHFTCYLIDIPGGGFTRWTRETEFTWPEQAKSIRHALDELLGDREYSVFAQDSGAMIGRELCLEDPDRARKLVMTNTEIPYHRPPLLPLVRAMLFVPGFWKLLQIGLRSPALVRSRWFFAGCFDDLTLFDGDFEDRILEPLARNGYRMRGHAQFLKGWSWPRLDEWRELHGQLRQPVLLVWGRNDGNFPLIGPGNGEPDAKYLPLQIPDCRLVVVEGARLWVHEERPQEVARAALEFLH